MSKIIYEIMHRENCVAQISTVGECKIYLEDFMPYDLMLEESNDFDKRKVYCALCLVEGYFNLLRDNENCLQIKGR